MQTEMFQCTCVCVYVCKHPCGFMQIDRLWLTAKACCGKPFGTGLTEPTQRVVQKCVICFSSSFCQLLKKLNDHWYRLFKYNHLIVRMVWRKRLYITCVVSTAWSGFSSLILSSFSTADIPCYLVLRWSPESKWDELIIKSDMKTLQSTRWSE